jgi:tRNA pseudouridine55 synthase
LSADGFLNLLKPPGMTSHDAVAWLRRLTGASAGHAGTLDRPAAGVLVLCVGKARRLYRWAAGSDRSYVAEITLGLTTDTLDADGIVLADRDASSLTRAAVEQALRGFVGEIEQSAPAYSALHAGGVRLRDLARQGRDVPRRVRKVRILSAHLLNFTGGAAGGVCRHPRARIVVKCSTGTYIRSLAADLGQALGCGAYLSFLVRARVGVFDVADSLTVEEVATAVATGRFDDLLNPLDAPLAALPAVRLDADSARRLCRGTSVAAPTDPPAGLARIYDPDARLLGLAEISCARLRPRVIVAE